jgi:hypothetical protein
MESGGCLTAAVSAISVSGPSVLTDLKSPAPTHGGLSHHAG